MEPGIGEDVRVEVAAEHAQRIDDHEQFVRMPEQFAAQNAPGTQNSSQDHHCDQNCDPPPGNLGSGEASSTSSAQPNNSVHEVSNSSELSSRRRSNRMPGKNTGSLPARNSSR